MKICFKCKIQKPLSEFYAHRAMADGRLNKCKECAKKDVMEHRELNLDKVREYDRKRGKLPHRISLNVRITRGWRQADPRRTAAQNAVARAVLAGTLIQENCSRCDSEKSVAHHEDYDNKLDVVWLCQICHKQRHREIDSERR